jgi:hypothetical protein
VAGASFALFISAATPQKDAFAAGTVTLGEASPPMNCVVENIVPGDSGTCTYALTYTGSLNAWVGLNVQTSAVAVAAYRPTGSLTTLGGEALLNDGTTDSGGLVVSLTDQFHGSATNANLTVPAIACPASDSAGAEGSGALLSASACNSPQTTQLLASPFAGNPSHPNGQPAESWSNGTQNTVTVHWSLPLTSPDAYQGGSAEIQIQAQAVQASNNALSGGTPTIGSPANHARGVYDDAVWAGLPAGRRDGDQRVRSHGSALLWGTGAALRRGGMLGLLGPRLRWQCLCDGPVGHQSHLTISLPSSTGAFYMYIEPNTFGAYTITATAQNGTTSGPISVDSYPGGAAQYFGFYGVNGDTIQSITVTGPEAASGFAVGEFGIAKS